VTNLSPRRIARRPNGSIEKRIKMQHRSNETSRRVETIPGIGVLGATAIVATVADPKMFRS
jgi:transposase